MILALLVTGPARGDGDPASDVLASQSLFLPQDARIPPTQQAQLTALLASARARGYLVRVAVIASAGDLGSVTALWRQPGNYARFLGQELSLTYHGPLLVVMPGGYGGYQPGAAGATVSGPLARLAAPGMKLGDGAIAAVRRLAAAAGHPLPLPPATARPGAGSSDPLEWLVLALGAVLIAACGNSSSSTTTLAAAGGPPSTASRSALRTCLRQHGVNLPARPGSFRNRNGGRGGAPGAGGGPPAGGAFFGGGGSGARFRNNPKLAAAFKACGGRALPRRRFRLSHSAVNRFVACVRQHGYNMPNPKFLGNGPIFPAGIRTNSKFQTASRSCAKLLFPRAPSGQTTTDPTS
jgi:hypothetical protein